MECRVFEKVPENQKFFNIPKMPKIAPKSVQTCFEHVLAAFFSKKFFCPVSHGIFSLREFSKKSENFLKFHKCTKLFPKVSKRVLNMFWGSFFEKIFSPVFHGMSSLRKISKKSKKFSKFHKCTKSFSKVSKSVLNRF